MERLDGVPLSVRADEGKILPDAVISILLQVCDALIAAHAAGVVHRDLKVDNIFLTDEGVKVLDWGIAKVIAADPHHTIEGQLVGTPQYLAPEQARGGVVSPATDVYSLGVVAYELFLEQLPFEAETSAEIMAMHLRQAPPPPRELWPDIPPTLEQLVLAMLAKDADARPTMLEVARTLEKVRDELEQRRRASANDRSGIVRGTPTTPVPEERRSIAWSSAPGLAPTAPAAPRTRSRRWQLVVGGLAVAVSAAMVLVTRDADSDTAVPPPSQNIVPLAVDVTAEVGPSAIAAADAPAPPLKLSPPAAAPAHATSRPAPSAPSHRHVAKPRRDLSHDPDGTIDPYR
jgi:serine/threonine-protein kinase